MKRAVASLGPKEIKAIIEEQGKIEVRRLFMKNTV